MKKNKDGELILLDPNPPTWVGRKCECTQICDEILWGNSLAVRLSNQKLISLTCAKKKGWTKEDLHRAFEELKIKLGIGPKPEIVRLSLFGREDYDKRT
jgi:hypothetical protein